MSRQKAMCVCVAAVLVSCPTVSFSQSIASDFEQARRAIQGAQRLSDRLMLSETMQQATESFANAHPGAEAVAFLKTSD